MVCLTCHSDIDHDVSTASCRSLLGYSVHLLSGTISTTVVVSDWYITNLAHGWWVSFPKLNLQWFYHKSKGYLLLSGPLRRCLQQCGIRSVFMSDTTLRLRFLRPKDADPRKQDGVVHKIPCECGKVYLAKGEGAYMN